MGEMMKKMTSVLFALGLVVILVGAIGTVLGTDIIAESDKDQSINTISHWGQLNNDSYNGMMGSKHYNNINEDYSNLEKLDVELLEEKVNDYINNIDENLEIADVFIFSDSDYYYSIVEKDTGMGAMELLVNPYTGSVYLEYGPNMMWNLKYGMMRNSNMMGFGGMMGYNNTSSHGGMMKNGNTIDYDRILNSQNTNGRWCDDYDNTNYKIGTEIKTNEISFNEAFNLGSVYINGQVEDVKLSESYHEFYGYFTFHVEYKGEASGMLSVNAFTGDVWFHDWHGNLIEIIGNHKDDEH